MKCVKCPSEAKFKAPTPENVCESGDVLCPRCYVEVLEGVAEYMRNQVAILDRAIAFMKEKLDEGRTRDDRG